MSAHSKPLQRLSQTRWMLSGDTKFASPSNKTGIDYIADFDHYIARIDELVRKGTWSITDTFKFYNDHVFAPSRTLQSVIPTKVPVSTSEEEEAIWKSLEDLNNEPDPELDIASIANAPISSREATISPPHEPPAADHHSVIDDMSPGPAGADVDASNMLLDLGKASRSKKRGGKVSWRPGMQYSRERQYHYHHQSSTQAKWEDMVMPTTTHATLRVCFADSVENGEGENEDDDNDDDEEEEEEEE
ncbi:hypothetical protein IW262DRAFT_1302415 [Armillaria fumosa]|nr:hypothetical protein IW262DRAFT_1302415 [Armillaria fumosa]